jgi:hypothetical protein
MAPKLRVYQLARELNPDNSEIIRELQHMGVPVTSHSNTVEDRLADSLRKKLGVYEEEPVKAKGKEAAAPPQEEIKEVQVEAPVIEPPHPPAPAEPVRVEAKAEPKVEPKVEEKPPTPATPPPAEKGDCRGIAGSGSASPAETPFNGIAATDYYADGQSGHCSAATTGTTKGRATTRAAKNDANDCSGNVCGRNTDYRSRFRRANSADLWIGLARVCRVRCSQGIPLLLDSRIVEQLLRLRARGRLTDRARFLRRRFRPNNAGHPHDTK